MNIHPGINVLLFCKIAKRIQLAKETTTRKGIKGIKKDIKGKEDKKERLYRLSKKIQEEIFALNAETFILNLEISKKRKKEVHHYLLKEYNEGRITSEFVDTIKKRGTLI
jgi:hypothetical protein